MPGAACRPGRRRPPPLRRGPRPRSASPAWPSRRSRRNPGLFLVDVEFADRVAAVRQFRGEDVLALAAAAPVLRPPRTGAALAAAVGIQPYTMNVVLDGDRGEPSGER